MGSVVDKSSKSLVKYVSEHLEVNITNTKVELPSEFKSLIEPNNSIEYKHAISYLKRRNITLDDIMKYNIGYCESGVYSNCIVIPSQSCHITRPYPVAWNVVS